MLRPFITLLGGSTLLLSLALSHTPAHAQGPWPDAQSVVEQTMLIDVLAQARVHLGAFCQTLAQGQQPDPDFRNAEFLHARLFNGAEIRVTLDANGIPATTCSTPDAAQGGAYCDAIIASYNSYLRAGLNCPVH